MFKHITPHPWTALSATVWGYESNFGQPQVASCVNKNQPMATQRANARLISIAPQMYEIIQKMQSEDAKELVRYMEKETDHADQDN
jgi:hypothetical protein